MMQEPNTQTVCIHISNLMDDGWMMGGWNAMEKYHAHGHLPTSRNRLTLFQLLL